MVAVDTAKEAPAPKKTKFLKNFRNYFREYCNSTSIHGFRYFGEKRTVFEKLWWFVIFMLCLASCALVIYMVYQKWATSPIIVSFDTTGRPIYKIPFPAVTVCSESKIKQSVFNYTNMVAKKRAKEVLSEKEDKILNDLGGFLCKNEMDLNYNSSVNKTDDLLDLLEEVSPDFFPVNCRVLGFPVECREIFMPIITDEGICYTSNMLGRKEIFREDVQFYKHYMDTNTTATNWTIETGYSEAAPSFLAYPKRALMSGGRYELSFDLKMREEDIDETCRDAVEGYKVLLHIPVRYPLLTQQYITIPLDQLTSLAIRPTTITTSESIKGYSAEQRRCYFPSEKTLKHFKIYTALNCRFECLANKTLAMCSCVPFYMPRENGTRICNILDYECAVWAEYSTEIVELESSMGQSHHGDIVDCSCLPMCTDIDYNVAISQTNWNWAESKTTKPNETSGYHWSRVNAYFVTANFIGSVRNELYGPTDFLANFGGVLGLFTGFSILSLMELIYFLSVRIFCNWKLFGFWSGPEN